MLSFKHYTVAVHDLEQAIQDYQSRFGMEAIGDRHFNGIGKFNAQPMGYQGQVVCHLICPTEDDSPIRKLMNERTNAFNQHGEGIYLVAYEADDVDAVCQQVEAGGGRVNRVPGSSNAWIHPTASHFVLMEVFPRKSGPALLARRPKKERESLGR